MELDMAANKKFHFYYFLFDQRRTSDPANFLLLFI